MGRFFNDGGSGSNGGGRFFDADGRPRTAGSAEPLSVGDTPGEAPYSQKLNTNKRDLAQTLHRLHAAGDTTNFNKIATQYGNVFTPEELKFYGLDAYGKGGDSAGGGGGLWGKVKNTAGAAIGLGDTITGGGLSRTLETLDYTRAAGVGGFRQAHAGLSRGLDALPGVEVAGADQTKWGWDQFKRDVEQRTGFGDLWQETKQQAAEEGDTTLFGSEALQNSKWVDRGVGLVGDVALDPLTYVSFGGGSLAKSSLKSIGTEFGDDMVRTIRQEGLRGALKKGTISELEYEAIRNLLRRDAEQLVQSAAKRRSVRRLVEKEGAEAATEQLADRSLSAVLRSGRSGLRVGNPFGSGELNATVLPSRVGGMSVPGLQAKYAPRVPGAAVTAGSSALDAAPAPKGILDDVPTSTEPWDEEMTQNLLTVADRLAPAAADDIVAAGPGSFVYRDADGAVKGYLGIADGKVETLYVAPELRGQSISKRLYQAADDAGLDVASLGADSVTAAGRAARESYLRGSAPALKHPREITWKAGDALGDNFTVLGKADDGTDLFIQPVADDVLIPFERNPRRLSVQPGTDDASKAITGGARKGNVPFSELKRGDRIPGVGVVKQISDDGILRVFPDPDVLPPGADQWTLFPEGAGNAATQAADGADSAAVAGNAALRGGQASDPIRRSIAGMLRETRPGQSVRKAFVPRTAIRDALGAGASERVYEAVEQASASAGSAVNDMLRQVGKVSNEAARELRGGPGRALADVLPASQGRKGYELFNDLALGTLEGTMDVAAVRSALAADGMENAVKALDAFESVVRQGDEALTAAKGAEEATTLFPQAEPGVPRILTKEGETLAKGDRSLGLAEILGVDSSQLRAGEDLTKAVSRVSGDAPVRQVNADLTKRLNLPEEVKLFEDDAMAAIALRGKTSFEAAAQTSLLENLAKQTADGTNPMVITVRATDSPLKKARALEQAEKAGYKPIKPNGKDPMIGASYAHPDVADEVARVQDMMVNDESLKQVAKFLTEWNGVWASYATVPVVFGTGFHARNSIGNVILSFMGGLTNPARFAEGADIQFQVGRARALMKKEGISWEEALPKAVKSERKRALINDMRAHGVISNGFFADLAGDEMETLLQHKNWKDWMSASGAARRVKQGASNAGLIVAVKDNALIRSGRRIGDVVENNARVALYMDAFAKTGSVQAAANTVKKYLFDYGDLTPFERRYMKSLNRFYTFTRKNVAVQLYTMAMDPWRIKAVTSAEGALYDPEGTGKAPLPDYARKGGFGISALLGRPEGTEGVALGIDTPLDNAVKTLDPIAQAVSMVPGIRNVVPPEYRSDKQQLAKSVLNLRAGGPVEMVNFLYEQATGKDTFSGKDISDESSADTFKRLTAVISPLYTKGSNFAETPVWEENMGMDLRLNLLKSLVGVNVLPITDKQRNQVAYVGAQEAQNILDDMREAGIDAPTYTDLVAAGLAPDLSAPRNGERRSPGEAAQSREDKINAARTAFGAEPIQVQSRSGGRRSFFG